MDVHRILDVVFGCHPKKKRGRIEDVIWGLRRILVSLIILLMTLNKATITRVRLTEIITYFIVFRELLLHFEKI